MGSRINVAMPTKARRDETRSGLIVFFQGGSLSFKSLSSVCVESGTGTRPPWA
jgi:hypothetical protein